MARLYISQMNINKFNDLEAIKNHNLLCFMCFEHLFYSLSLLLRPFARLLPARELSSVHLIKAKLNKLRLIKIQSS